MAQLMFSRECSIDAILQGHVATGNFSGGDYRVRFDDRPARRGQPFVAAWVRTFSVAPSSVDVLAPASSPDCGFSWSTFLAASFDQPLAPGSLRACLLPSPTADADAVLILVSAQSGTRRRRRRPSDAPGAIGEGVAAGSDSASADNDTDGGEGSDGDIGAGEDGWHDWETPAQQLHSHAQWESIRVPRALEVPDDTPAQLLLTEVYCQLPLRFTAAAPDGTVVVAIHALDDPDSIPTPAALAARNLPDWSLYWRRALPPGVIRGGLPPAAP